MRTVQMLEDTYNNCRYRLRTLRLWLDFAMSTAYFVNCLGTIASTVPKEKSCPSVALPTPIKNGTSAPKHQP